MIVAPLTLDQASDLAIRNNPILLRDRARIDSAEGLAWQAGIAPNPRYDGNNPQTFAGNQSIYNVGVAAEVPVAGKLRLNRSAAEQGAEQARMTYIRERFELLTAVRKQFYRVLVLQRRVVVLSELEQIAAQSHAAAQQKETAGIVAETDVLLLTVELQQVRISLENTRTLLEGARRALAATIGMPNLPIHEAKGSLVDNFPDVDDEYVRRFVTIQNAAVLQAQSRVQQNRFLLQRAQVEPYPNPYMGPAVAWGPSAGSGGKAGEQFWYSLQVSIPVWNWNQGGILAANANVRDAVASVEIVQNDLLRNVAETLSSYHASQQLADRIASEIQPTAERAQRLVRSAYEVGVLDVAEVLQAQHSLTLVSLSYITALENAWDHAAELAGLLQIESFP